MVASLKRWSNLFVFSPPYSEIQPVCGFSCEDIASMFKELRGLGVIVKNLSIDLRKVVSSMARQGLPFVTVGSLFFSPTFPVLTVNAFPAHLSL